MAVASALVSLGSAIHEEIQTQLKTIQQELEHERQCRQLLEDQVSKLQQAVYTTTQIDDFFESRRRRDEEQAECVRAEAEKVLRAAQRELEHRIESALSGFKSAVAEDEVGKPSLKASDLPLLTNEIDRKLGNVLVDMDTKLADLRAINTAELERAARSAAEHADRGDTALQAHVAAVQNALVGDIGSLQQTLQAQAGLEGRISFELEKVRTSLTQDLGKVMLEVDAARLEFQQNVAR
mmetsp:Transcript_100067/g.254440  ORF Transcript_100067/g.254440 Transcript_100067/m.254440 type:complete len:238 (-) Transcript_100067:26-739(-)